MVHLVCLHCNRSNAAGAKYCVECGAGLLRKFCGSCHAVNDAESRFCQSCGHELPMAPESVPAAMPAPALAPGLAQVLTASPDGTGRPFAADANFDACSIVEVKADAPPMAALDLARESAQRRRWAYRTPAMFGASAVIAMGMAFGLWPRSEPPAAVPKADTMVPTAQAPAASGLGATVVVASPTETQAAGFAVLQEPVVGHTPADAAPAQRIASEAAKPLAKRTTAQGPPAPVQGGLSRSAGRLPAPKPAPPDECTPAMDALALCAPGAKVTGR